MSYFDDVKAWHKKFEVPTPSYPVVEPEWQERWKVTVEELREFEDAMFARDKVKSLDAIVDGVFVLIGTAVRFGWNFDEAWTRLLESNYSKLGPNGEVIRNEWGKIMKGSNFIPLKLDDLVLEREKK